MVPMLRKLVDPSKRMKFIREMFEDYKFKIALIEKMLKDGLKI